MAAAKKTARTRQGILDAYVDLLATNSYDKISVSMLCREAGIVRSTFYTYYSDIFDVIQAVEDNLISAFDQVDQEIAKADPWGPNPARTEWGLSLEPPFGFRLWFAVCEDHKHELAAMLGPNGDPYFESKFRKQLNRHANLLMDIDGMPQDELRRGFCESMEEIHLLLTRNWLLHEHTSLSADRICSIINAMRVGGNTKQHYELIAGGAKAETAGPMPESDTREA